MVGALWLAHDPPSLYPPRMSAFRVSGPNSVRSADGPITAVNIDAAHVSHWREAAILPYDDAASLRARYTLARPMCSVLAISVGPIPSDLSSINMGLPAFVDLSAFFLRRCLPSVVLYEGSSRIQQIRRAYRGKLRRQPSWCRSAVPSPSASPLFA